MFLRTLRNVKNTWFATSPMDTDVFLDSWESKYGNWHDPIPLEVINRLVCLADKDQNSIVCEIGAGYGRILSKLGSNFVKIGIEPDPILYKKLKESDCDLPINCKAHEIPPVLGVQFFYSVRALEYVTLPQVLKMMRVIKIHYPNAILLTWERKRTSTRLRIARRILGWKNCFVNEIVN